MQVYLVGGAVRDKLLQLPVMERDWLVVGSTPQEMIKLGYKPVGKDFPVFLHPQTHEEYALARTERKSGKRHGDFIFNASPEVSLEQDLIRRDLTINAIAEDYNGQIIDPYGGQHDIKLKQLRHVSEAFIEDPLRILRVARFMAKFGPMGFHIAPETLDLMRNMVAQGELAHLSQERIWQEVQKSLISLSPAEFFKALQACSALENYFPFMTDQGIMALERSCILTQDPVIRYAAACYEGYSRLQSPTAYSTLARLCNQNYKIYSEAALLPPKELLQFYKQVDALRRPERFKQFALACQAITTFDHQNYLMPRLEGLLSLEFETLSQHYKGQELAGAIDQKRIEFLSTFDF